MREWYLKNRDTHLAKTKERARIKRIENPRAKPTLLERFLKFIAFDEDGHWRWTGAKHSFGHGRLGRGDASNKVLLAHRVSYELFVGPIPDGLEIDHLCRIPSCCNPDHLEPVTHKVNCLRGVGSPAANARRTHCIRGHEFAGNNLHIGPDGKRYCRTCDALRGRRERAKIDA